MRYAHQYYLNPIQGQGEGHRSSEVPKIALFQVCLRHFRVELKTDGWWW